MDTNIIRSADRMNYVHSDIRGPLYQETLRMQAQGIDLLRLNTGNPAAFGFTMPDSVRNALLANADRAVGYCDSRGMKEARENSARPCWTCCAMQTASAPCPTTPLTIYFPNTMQSALASSMTTPSAWAF